MDSIELLAAPPMLHADHAITGTMGAWDASSFGNDTANDWVYDLEEHSDLSFVEATMKKVLKAGDGYLDSSLACEAIAAVEVVASLLGKPPVLDAYTEKVAKWVSTHALEVPDNVVRMAIDTLDRIQSAPSELSDLWEDDPDWLAAMADLRERLATG